MESASTTTSAPAPAESSWTAFWRTVTRFDRSQMSLPMSLRNTLGIAIPLLAALAMDAPRAGVTVCIGALNVAFSDGSDPYRPRAQRMLAATFFCALAGVAGGLFLDHTAVAVLAVGSWAFVAGMLVAVSPAAGDIGLLSLILLVIFSAQSLTFHEALVSGLLLLGGGVLQTAISVAVWPVQPYGPEQRALAAFYGELSRFAGSPALPGESPPATAESIKAEQSLQNLGGSTAVEAARYRGLFNQAERLRASLVTLRRAEGQAQHADIAPTLARALALSSSLLAAVQRSLLAAEEPLTDAELREIQQLSDRLVPGAIASAAAVQPQLDAIAGQLRAASELAAHATPAGSAAFADREAAVPLSLRFTGFLAALRANMNLRSSFFRHAVRLAVCVGLGEAIARNLPWQRTYWLPMTVAIVLKPEFAGTFARGLLRIAGTAAGLLLTTALFHFFALSHTLEAALIILSAFLLRWVGRANYGILTVTISAFVVLEFAVMGAEPGPLIIARSINTLAGGALALAAYALWPTWETTQSADWLARMFEASSRYVHLVTSACLDPRSDDERQRESARVAARLARSNFEASLGRLAAEPGTTPAELVQLHAVLASYYRFAYSIIALEAALLRRREVKVPGGFAEFMAAAERTLLLFVAVLRGEPVTAPDFPALREAFRRLQAPPEGAPRSLAVFHVEADHMVNSLNTIRERLLSWKGAAPG